MASPTGWPRGRDRGGASADGRPTVGVGAIRAAAPPGGDSAQEVPEAYLRAVIGAGAQPLVIPIGLSEPALARLLDQADGVLLVGGPDVDPSLYGEERRLGCGPTNLERDRSELMLARRTLERGLPLLAICRGIQILNVTLGGTLYQDLGADRPDSEISHRAQERQRLVHSVRLDPGSRLAATLGTDKLMVNSLHHQAVKEVAKPLRAVGWACDGLVEAMERPGEPFVVGVQWHPEELLEVVEHASRLFAAFSAAARDHQSASSTKGS